MSIDRIKEVFRKTQAAGRRAWVPYFTAGFPDREICRELILRADRFGATVIEVGFPYSDSIADGPIIQGSHHEVLSRGHRVADTFELVEELRPSLSAAVVAMVSCSVIHRIGVIKFMSQLAKAGFDGVLVPDVPFEESAGFVDAAKKADLGYVGLIAPTTKPDRRALIASASTGFVYQMAHAGITGERSTIPLSLKAEVAQTRLHARVPICVGFGVSTPAQVRAICQIADGVIVGSAIMRRLQEGVQACVGRSQQIEEISAFLMELAEAAQAD
ncbi:MAG: tryptophan synthase subunit alpha [Planctomycetota bacterium]